MSTEPFRTPSPAGEPPPSRHEADNVITPAAAAEIVSLERLAWLRSILQDSAAGVGADASASPAQKARALARLDALEAEVVAAAGRGEGLTERVVPPDTAPS